MDQEGIVMQRKLINYLGLTGVVALLSYAAAVIFSPLAYPGYDWMAQAVSDLSSEAAPSTPFWGCLCFRGQGQKTELTFLLFCAIISLSRQRRGVSF